MLSVGGPKQFARSKPDAVNRIRQGRGSSPQDFSDLIGVALHEGEITCWVNCNGHHPNTSRSVIRARELAAPFSVVGVRASVCSGEEAQLRIQRLAHEHGWQLEVSLPENGIIRIVSSEVPSSSRSEFQSVIQRLAREILPFQLQVSHRVSQTGQLRQYPHHHTQKQSSILGSIARCSVGGRLPGIDEYRKVMGRAPATDLLVGADLVHTGMLQAAAFLRAYQHKERTKPQNEPIVVLFATGATQWMGYTCLKEILAQWGTWKGPETRSLLVSVGVDTVRRPDFRRMLAGHLDTIFPQSRDAHYEYANELHHMFDLLGIPASRRLMWYGDMKALPCGEVSLNPKRNRLSQEEFAALMRSVNEEGILLNAFQSGTLDPAHVQASYLHAMSSYARKLSDFYLRLGGPDIVFFGLGGSYDGQGHFAFNESGTPYTRGTSLVPLSFHAAAGNMKESGGMGAFFTENGAARFAALTMGPWELLNPPDTRAGPPGRRTDTIYLTTVTHKAKASSVKTMLEAPPDRRFPPTLLQGGAPLSALIADVSAIGETQYARNPLDYIDSVHEGFDATAVSMDFVTQFALRHGKPISALTLRDIEATGRELDFSKGAHCTQRRLRNLEYIMRERKLPLDSDGVRRMCRDAHSLITGRLISSAEVPRVLGLDTAGPIVHIGPHLDDLSLAASFLIKPLSQNPFHSFYTAPGYTAVGARYVMQALETALTLPPNRWQQIRAAERKFEVTEGALLAELIEQCGSQRERDPSDYRVWQQLSEPERELRAALMLIQVNDASEILRTQKIDSAEKLEAVAEVLRLFALHTPDWGATEPNLLSAMKVALRFAEEQTELMARGIKQSSIYRPLQSSWYGVERHGTAQRSDINSIEQILSSLKPHLVITNGEGFIDHGPHCITEMSVRIAVMELYKRKKLPADLVMLLYRGVWDRTAINPSADQIYIGLTESELRENRRSFLANYPSQSPAQVPDAGLDQPQFFCDQVIANARRTKFEFENLSGKPAPYAGILAFDIVRLASVSPAYFRGIEQQRSELAKVQRPLIESSLTSILGAPPPAIILPPQQLQACINRLRQVGLPISVLQ